MATLYNTIAIAWRPIKMAKTVPIDFDHWTSNKRKHKKKKREKKHASHGPLSSSIQEYYYFLYGWLAAI